jgi:hypothetical protein
MQKMSIDEEFAEASVPVTAQPAAAAAQPAAAKDDAMPSAPVKPIAIGVQSDGGTKSSEDAELEKLMAETGMT